MATACPEPKTCGLCGGGDNLFRACPSRQKTYASLFKEGQDLQADFDGLLMSVSGRRESQEAGPSGVGAGGGVERRQVAETSTGDVVEKEGGLQDLQMNPSQVCLEIDVAEVLCGIYGEMEPGVAESLGREGDFPSVMETEQDTMGSDMGQGLRRRKLGEDVIEDRARKCSKVQVQEFALRQIQSKETVGEMDTGERVVGERVVGESGVNGKGGGGGVLEKVKSILWEDKGGGEKGSEGEGGKIIRAKRAHVKFCGILTWFSFPF